MKHFRIVILLLACVVLGHSQAFTQDEGLVAPVYGWHAYTSHKYIAEVSVMGDSAYAITEGGLVLYNMITRENTILTTVDGLSNVDPSAILADPLSQQVFIGFKDGAINFIDADGQLHIVSDIERNEQFTAKRINHLFAKDGLLYIATDFGVVVYDILARETKYSIAKIGNNATGAAVSAVTMSQGRLWASMGSLGIWSVDISVPNPTLPGLWEQASGNAGLPLGISSYVCATGDLLFAQVRDTIFQKQPSRAWERSNFPVSRWIYLNADSRNNVYGAAKPGTLAILYPDSNLIVGDNYGRINCLAVARYGDPMIGDSLFGLQTIRLGEGQFDIGPNCPRNNNVADIAAHNGELYIAPKGRNGSSARYYDKSGIPFFDLHKEGWKITDHRDGTLTDVYQDFYRVAIDTATGRCIVGSWGEGLVEMQNGQYVRSYNSSNSGLHYGQTGHLVSGLAFDTYGNLWITQGLNDVPLQCLTADGQWYSFQPPFSMNAYGLTLDELGNKWVINNGNGIGVFQDNFSPENPSDDEWMPITTSYSQGALPNNSVFTIAQDHDLQIWIGTSEGVTVMYDPTLLFTRDFQNTACPLIDGYCLFRDQQVNDFAVDGYNRKWIATENGVFLVNLDGTELLEHFTEANSPLLADEVRSIAVDAATGEVFFGTAKGVISYIGDAVEGSSNAESLYAYPNPVYVNQETPVMIKGMRRYSKVKVTTVAGRLVRELDSQGGSVPWDLKDSYGNRVTPGIYLVMVSDPDGKGAGITKIAILEQQN